MSKNPKITIVTVVYNGAEFLENTILSVCKQTYKNLEYIIVDGGSTDGTIDIIRKYSDKISHWISEPDKGIYDAMNKGTSLASGEWILFRNCGDYFSSLSDVSNVFEDTNYDGVDIIYGDAILWDEYGFRKEKPESENLNRLGVMPVWHPSTFVRTSLQKKRPFDLKYKLAADHDFIINCRNSGKKFKYVPIVLSIFNIGEGASVKGQTVSKKEHFYIYGGNDTKKLSLLVLNFQILKIRIFLFLRKICPKIIMKFRRKIQNRYVWNSNYTIKEMVFNALTQEIVEYK